MHKPTPEPHDPSPPASPDGEPAPREPRQAAEQASLRIVGIGASAGGVPALQRFFEAMPENPGLAFVVVMHLSTEFESRLAEVLQHKCPIEVTQVEHSVELEADHVYVIPPGKHIDSVDTHVTLTDKEPGEGHGSPIDHFFRTLAASSGSRAVGVVLSGEGDDGTVGIRRIREAGGLTIAQSPEDAEHESMPRAAIATGRVDVTLSASEMVRYIVSAANTGDQLSRAEAMQLPESGETLEDQGQTLNEIFSHLRSRTGHDFNQYKRPTIMRRIARRMQINHVSDFGDYLQLVRDSAEEQGQLYEDLLITVTEFFRDPEVFEKVGQSVIPEVFRGKTGEDTVRVWSVGCSTGEEAYSLAMLLLEEAEHHTNPPSFRVFASDVHQPSLEVARQGSYPKAIEADVSDERLRRFFIRDNGGYRVREDLRGAVTFAPHNFLKDPPFSRLDLVVCRNVLIYLRREVQKDVLRLFHYALNPDGLLVLGNSESVEDAELFARENRKIGLYRRRNVPSGEQRLPVFPLSKGLEHKPLTSGPRGSKREAGEGYGQLHEKIVEQYGPPSVLINPKHEVVHYSASAGRFLEMPGGQPTQELFRLARSELRGELRSTILTAADRNRPTRSHAVDLDLEGERHRVVIRAIPPADSQLKGFMLVMFDELDPDAGGGTPAKAAEDESQRVQELQNDLDLNRERLHNVSEEYETSQEEMRATNEELQSTNEELRSALEELETSKEELQSMNEELATANAENRQRVEELSQLTADLQNLLESTRIATLFLDRDLKIVRFTPKVEELFNIRHSDTGRPLTDLTHQLTDGRLTEDAQRVLDQHEPVEREVRSHGGRWYLTRVLPYYDSDRSVTGVVLTLIDITQRKDAEQTLRDSEQRQRIAAEAAGLGVFEWRPDEDRPIWNNDRMYELFGLSPERDQPLSKKELVDTYLHPDDRSTLEDALEKAREKGGTLHVAVRIQHPASEAWRWIEYYGRFIEDESQPPRWTLVGVIGDITDRVEQQHELRRARDELEQRVQERTAELRQTNERLRSLASQLTSAETRERKRLAMFLHDDLQQLLVAAQLQIGQLRNKVGDGDATQLLERLNDVIHKAQESTHDLTRQLRPTALYEVGITPAVRWLVEQMQTRHGLDVKIDAQQERFDLQDDVKALLFDAVRELLFNVVKHSGQLEAEVGIREQDDNLLIRVEDHGKGFDAVRKLGETAGTGMGLFAIRERLSALGGRMSLESLPGDGTRAELTTPLDIARADGEE